MPSPAASPPSARPTRPAKRRTRCTEDGCRRLAPPGRKRCSDHKPGRRAPKRPQFGTTTPRLFTRPLRPLTRATTRGFEVIDFARMIGEPLLPWQEHAVIHAMETMPDGSYRFRIILILVGRQNGKSHLKRIVTLWRMYVDGARHIIGAAQDLSLAREQWVMCQETIHNSPELQAEWGAVRNVNGDEMFWAGGGRYAIKATNRKAGRGTSNDEVNIDELREQRDWAAWSALSKTTMARPNSQLWAMSNAGDDESVVLNQIRAAALAGTDPSVCIQEWSGEDGCQLDDWAQIAQANPGMGYTVSAAAIQTAMATDPPNVFRTEVLCQKVDQLDGAIDLARWQAAADPAGNMNDAALRRRLAVCFDIAPDGRHATLAAAAMLDDGRVRVEIVKAWTSTEAARRELDELLDRIRPAAIGWFPTGPGGAFAPMLRKRRGQVELTGMRVAEVCQGLADLVKALQVVHNADPLLDAHIGGAQKLASGDGWRFTRRGGGEAGHVDAAYAGAGAVNLALTMPPVQRARIHVIG